MTLETRLKIHLAPRTNHRFVLLHVVLLHAVPPTDEDAQERVREARNCVDDIRRTLQTRWYCMYVPISTKLMSSSFLNVVSNDAAVYD